MKVYIGPYRRFIGPYQVADLLKFFGVSDDKCFAIGEWLAEKTPLDTICNFVDNKKERKVGIHIDGYDVWNADNTLALIIHPLLVKFRANMEGASQVDDEDVPEAIRSTSAPPKQNEWDSDVFWFDRWNYALDEMVWAFDAVLKDETYELFYKENSQWDFDALRAYEARINNGTRLFGKYFRSLWT